MSRTQKHAKKPYKFDLEVKVQSRFLIMNVCDTSPHDHMMIHPCAKYGKPMSN